MLSLPVCYSRSFVIWCSWYYGEHLYGLHLAAGEADFILHNGLLSLMRYSGVMRKFYLDIERNVHDQDVLEGGFVFEKII